MYAIRSYYAVATVGLLDVHANWTLLIGVAPSSADAVSCWVLPGVTRVADGGLTVTVAPRTPRITWRFPPPAKTGPAELVHAANRNNFV